MTEAVMPVQFENKTIGIVMIGQFRTAKSLPKEIAKLSRKNAAYKEVLNSYLAAPSFTKQRAENIVKVFGMIVQSITTNRYIAISRESPIESVVEYVRNNPADKITVEDAAELIYYSKSRFTELFKRATGMTFKEFQTKNIIDKANEMFKYHPELSVKEIAFKLGFEDQFYFSRVYKKATDKTPSQAREAGIIL